MKSELKIKILNAISKGPLLAIDLFCIFTDPYKEGSATATIRRVEEVDAFNTKLIGSIEQRKRFNEIIYNLKKDGIISSEGGRTRSRKVFITNKGLDILAKVGVKKVFERPSTNYTKEDDGRLKIIAFDIPEKDRRKRSWLRATLVNLGFSLEQQSVWWGTSAIPEDFIQELKNLEILDKVGIFTIDKPGSLRRISLNPPVNPPIDASTSSPVNPKL